MKTWPMYYVMFHFGSNGDYSTTETWDAEVSDYDYKMLFNAYKKGEDLNSMFPDLLDRIYKDIYAYELNLIKEEYGPIDDFEETGIPLCLEVYFDEP